MTAFYRIVPEEKRYLTPFPSRHLFPPSPFPSPSFGAYSQTHAVRHSNPVPFEKTWRRVGKPCQSESSARTSQTRANAWSYGLPLCGRMGLTRLGSRRITRCGPNGIFVIADGPTDVYCSLSYPVLPIFDQVLRGQLFEPASDVGFAHKGGDACHLT